MCVWVELGEEEDSSKLGTERQRREGPGSVGRTEGEESTSSTIGV